MIHKVRMSSRIPVSSHHSFLWLSLESGWAGFSFCPRKIPSLASSCVSQALHSPGALWSLPHTLTGLSSIFIFMRRSPAIRLHKPPIAPYNIILSSSLPSTYYFGCLLTFCLLLLRYKRTMKVEIFLDYLLFLAQCWGYRRCSIFFVGWIMGEIYHFCRKVIVGEI